MGNQLVLLSAEEFRDIVLAIPDGSRFSHIPRHELTTNPFGELQGASEMTNLEVCMALLEAIDQHRLAPGCMAACCSARPDFCVIDGDGDTLDAALFDHDVELSSSRAPWTAQEVPIVFRQCGVDDEFCCDRNRHMEDDVEKRKEMLSKYLRYAAVLFDVQQRFFLVMIAVTGRTFRVLRWDRSRVVMSSAVDYFTNWQLFCDILWHISLAHRYVPEMLGADPTAVRLSSRDARWRRMAAAANGHGSDFDEHMRLLGDDESSEPSTLDHARNAFRETLVAEHPRYQVEVPDGNRKRYFLICRPTFVSVRVSRGTRGYIALEYDPTPSSPGQERVDRFVFLKDVWRMTNERIRQGGGGISSQGGVLKTPTLLCHDSSGERSVPETTARRYRELQNSSLSSSQPPSYDLSSAGTIDSVSSTPRGMMKHKKSADDGELPAHAPTGLPDDFNADEDIGIGDSYSLRGLIHYRCIIEQVEKMLGGAGSGHELLSRIADCVQAHQQANEKSESFDRNVSVDNELSYPKLDVTEGDSVGRLTDQGLSVNLEGTCRSLQREQPEIGQFSSYAIAISRYIYFNGRSKLAVVADDLESFWYILLYHAILRIRSNCSGWAIWIQFFQSHLAILEREHAVRFGVLEIRGVGKLSFKDATINGVIYDLLGLFPAHYKVVEYDRRRKLHPSDKNPPPTGAELALAENVKDHEMFLEILEKALISLR